FVISTMGGSVWIMGGVSPLQQVGAEQTRTAGSGARGAPRLLQPRDTMRYRDAARGRGGSGVPQYPPVAATIDYVLPQGFAGDLTIEIVNAAGMVVRTVRSAGDGGGV